MNASPGSIVRWEILKGLPAEGPIPKHFHVGRPTPWAEGLVVRFWNQDGTEWVGNFQGAQDSSTTILDWPEATSVVVLARYNLYLVDVGSPDTYVTLDASHHVDYIMLDETHAFLFAAESTAICAFNRKRQLVWSQKHLNGFDAQLVSCANGVLTIEVVEELGEPVRTVALSTTDGSII